MRKKQVRAGAIAGAIGFAMISVVAVPAAAPAQTPQGTVGAKLADPRLVGAQRARVSGRVAASLAGRTVALEFLAPGSAWRVLATSTVDSQGAYRVAARLPRSGRLRVTLPPPPGTATASSEPARSGELVVRLAPGLKVSGRRLHVRLGRRARLRGRIAPGVAGIPVRLEGWARGEWRTIDRARTRRGGAFRLSRRAVRLGSVPVRLVATPRAGLARGRQPVGRLNVYRYAHASWYGPGLYGNRTGCGGRLVPGALGVAHKTLPCGTRLTLRHRGRTVRVRVMDRGPYVGGREFDLTEATAQKLRFRGHGPLLVTR